jgi:hypothetical protein
MDSAMSKGSLPAPTNRMASDPAGRNELEIRSLQLQTLQWEFDRSHLHERATFVDATGAGFAGRR